MTAAHPGTTPVRKETSMSSKAARRRRRPLRVPTVVVLLGTDAAVAADWCYDPADPLAVTLAFHVRRGEVRWRLARELLAAGLLMSAGQGDVQLEPFPTGALLLRLRNQHEQAQFLLDEHDAHRLLTRSYQLVPLGAEALDTAALLGALLHADPGVNP